MQCCAPSGCCCFQNRVMPVRPSRIVNDRRRSGRPKILRVERAALMVNVSTETGLRAAILAANAGGDVNINFKASIQLTASLPMITSDLLLGNGFIVDAEIAAAFSSSRAATSASRISSWHKARRTAEAAAARQARRRGRRRRSWRGRRDLRQYRRDRHAVLDRACGIRGYDGHAVRRLRQRLEFRLRWPGAPAGGAAFRQADGGDAAWRRRRHGGATRRRR